MKTIEEMGKIIRNLKYSMNMSSVFFSEFQNISPLKFVLNENENNFF